MRPYADSHYSFFQMTNLSQQLGVISTDCELVDPDNVLKEIQILKSANVDGVMVDCWWGIVERHAPQQYDWSGYKSLFQIVRDLDLKLQVVMSFRKMLVMMFIFHFPSGLQKLVKEILTCFPKTVKEDPILNVSLGELTRRGS